MQSLYLHVDVHNIHVHVCITFTIIYITKMCVLACNAELMTSNRYHLTSDHMY